MLLFYFSDYIACISPTGSCSLPLWVPIHWGTPPHAFFITRKRRTLPHPFEASFWLLSPCSLQLWVVWGTHAWPPAQFFWDDESLCGDFILSSSSGRDGWGTNSGADHLAFHDDYHICPTGLDLKDLRRVGSERSWRGRNWAFQGKEKAAAKALRQEVAWRIPWSKQKASDLQLRVWRSHEEIGVG